MDIRKTDELFYAHTQNPTQQKNWSRVPHINMDEPSKENDTQEKP